MFTTPDTCLPGRIHQFISRNFLRKIWLNIKRNIIILIIIIIIISKYVQLLYTNIDQALINSLHRLIKYTVKQVDQTVMLLQRSIEHVSIVHTRTIYFVYSNALVHVIYSGVSDQCSYTIFQMIHSLEILCTWGRMFSACMLSKDSNFADSRLFTIL